jgi:hypothetical protein
MRIRASALLFMLLLTSCGGSTLVGSLDDGGVDIDAPMTPCGRFALAYCERKQACANGYLTRDFGDISTCVTRENLVCTNGLGAPHTGQSVALVEQCTSGMPSYSCADLEDGNLPETCNPLGPGDIGSPCTFNAQCATGYCNGDRYSTCGTCSAPPSAGSSCATSNCDHNQSCTWNNVVTNVCEPYTPTGSECGAYGNPPCQIGLTCAGASSVTGVGGTCEPALETAGETCGSQNMGLGCDFAVGLWCFAPPDEGASCIDISYVGDGMPCGYVGSGVAECTNGTCYSSGGPYFTYTGTTRTGTCKAFAADGAECDTQIGPECMAGARCVTTTRLSSGTCVVPTPSVSAACHGE